MKVSAKLYVGFAIIVTVAVIAGTVGLIGMQRVKEDGLLNYKEPVACLELLNRAEKEFMGIRVECRKAIIYYFYEDATGIYDSISGVETSSEKFEGYMNEYLKIAVTKDSIEHYTHVMDVYKSQYAPVVSKILDVIKNDIPEHKKEDEISLLSTMTIDIAGIIDGLLNTMISTQSTLVESTNNSSSTMTESFMFVQAAFIATAVIIAVIVSKYIVEIITKPIKESSKVLRLIEKGEFDARITGDYEGEFEIIKNSVNAMAVGMEIFLKDKLSAEHSAVEAEKAKTNAELVSIKRMRFLANMSHEIRTPMNGIMGLSELALDDDIPSKTRDYLVKIKSSADGLLAIINDILDVSKIEASELKLEKIPFDLNLVICECESLISHKAYKQGLNFEINIEGNIPERVIGDPTRLRQVLLNLLSNSLKFTNEGSITLTVRCGDIIDRKASIYFEIRDTGIGMSAEQHAVIFQPFNQADDSITRMYGGTGLGLTIAKNIIEMMGSEIQVESVVFEGSKFFFTITFKIAEHCQTVSQNEPLAMNQPIFKGDALVCEDNSTNQQVITENLRKLGFNIELAENGEKCVELVSMREREGRPFEIIFMDVHMPVMDGLSATKILVEMNVKAPIIAMTANALAEDRDSCLRSGMTDYISKPFKPLELWACLLKHLTPLGMKTVGSHKTDSDTVNMDVPINIELGMERCVQSEELYNKLLTNFLKEQPGIAEELAQNIQSKQFQTARLLAHTGKSVSSTIGAEALSELYRVLENKIETLRDVENGIPAIMDCYEKYKIELEKTLRYIKSMNPSSKRKSEKQMVTFTFDKMYALEAINQTEPFLQRDMPVDDFLVNKLRKALSPLGDSHDLLIEHIDNYDFNLALDVLNDMRSAIMDMPD